MYFVVECIVMAAPCLIGWQEYRTGRIVHDQWNAKDHDRPFPTSAMGNTASFGFGQCLAVIAAGPSASLARRKFSGSDGSDKATFNSHGAHGVFWNKIPGAAINVGRAKEVVAGVTDILHGD